MNILIIGSGGREHALAWKVAQSPNATQVWVAPGNAGTALETKVKNINIAVTDVDQLLDFAKKHAIGLTIVGPEAALALGIVDVFTQHGLACFGPTQKAAQLESSKAFSKAFMQRQGIPTAAYATFDDLAAAIAYVRQKSFPLVIKEDGLAAGKGVVIVDSLAQAETTLTQLFCHPNRVVIEGFLKGEEASFIVMADGKHYVALATSQDHKTIGEGGTGANTGGMGAYSPTPLVTPSLHQTILTTVIEPTLAGMAQEGLPYRGFLYAGLMIHDDQIHVLEFNCRLGDPETQVILPRLQSDLVTLCQAAMNQTLDQHTLAWDSRFAVGVVLAMKGYPGTYPQGLPITGLNYPLAGDQKIFHAGTLQKENNVVTAGGRVLCATGMGKTLADARQQAYAIVDHVDWEGKYFRRDIGFRQSKETL